MVISDPYDTDPSSNLNLSELGLVSVVMGCPKLHSIVYICSQMTNAALLAVAKHKPNLTSFLLIIVEPQLPDYLTQKPLDRGYSAILECCKNLKRLAITGLFTDQLLENVGTHGKKLEVLHLAFGRNTDLGLHFVLSGCNSMRKLSIRDCPIGGQALLGNSDRLERMQCFWMSSCTVSYGECKLLGEKHLRLNVEVINERSPLHTMSDKSLVENLYIYRTVAGPRLDMPAFVWSTNKKESLGQL